MAEKKVVEYVPCPIRGCNGKMLKGAKMCISCSREGMQLLPPAAKGVRQ
jgi:hypothetical protein